MRIIKAILLLLFLLGNIIGYSQETIEFFSNFPDTNVSPKRLRESKESSILNSERYGHFNITFINFPNKEAEYAFKTALALWEQKLDMKKDVKITAKFDVNIGNLFAYKVSITTDSYYNTRYPTALLKQLNSSYENSGNDITITFNGNMNNWDFSNSIEPDLSNDKVDFITESLRSIAKGLGFGGFSTGREDDVRIMKNYISNTKIQDRFGTRLSELNSPSPELNQFVHNDAFVSINDYTNYKLFTPNKFDPSISLNYFEPSPENDSTKLLMYPNLYGRVRYVGEKIINVLNELGWNNKINTIKCDQIDDNGIVKSEANKQYTFYFTDNSNIISYNWKYEIPQKDGTYRLIANGNNNTFPIIIPTEFRKTDDRTSSGYIKGKISLTIARGNGSTEEINYSLSIDYFPETPMIEVLNTIPIDEYINNIEVGFASRGANYYNVTIEDVYYGYTFSKIIYASDYNKTIFDSIINGDLYIITVEAYNKFGQKTENSINIQIPFQNNIKNNLQEITDFRESDYSKIYDYMQDIIIQKPKGEYKESKWDIDFLVDSENLRKVYTYTYLQINKDTENLEVNFKSLFDEYGTPKVPEESNKPNILDTHWKQNYYNNNYVNIIFRGLTSNNKIVEDTTKILLSINKQPSFNILSKENNESNTWMKLTLECVLPENSLPITHYWVKTDDTGWIQYFRCEKNSIWESPDDWSPSPYDEYIEVKTSNEFGDSPYSEPVHITYSGVDNISSDKDISIYPNPATSVININNIQDIVNIRAEIFNATGLKVFDEIISNPGIDISSLSNGYYVLVLTMNNKDITRMKFLKTL